MHATYSLPRIGVRDTSPAAPRKQNKPRGMQGKRTIPDADIIRMRTMYQVERKTLRQVMRAFPNISDDQVKAVLLYVVRTQPHLWVNGGRV